MHLFDRIRHRVAEHRRYVRTMRELENLTPRDLDDIGISPYDIRRVARQSSRQRAT